MGQNSRVTATVISGSAARRRAVWIYDARTDLAIALCWVPVWLAWHALTSGHGAGSDRLLRDGVKLALLVSFIHQPLTFGLIYGDARQFALRRRLFVIAPPVALAIAIPSAVLHWWAVVPIAALWNTQHTLQQRYGLQRIYARKSGYGSARLDRAFAYLPMVVVLLAIAAAPTTEGMIRRSGLGDVNSRGVRLLLDLRPAAIALLVVAGLATASVLAVLARQEASAGERANPAKWTYQLSSLALLASIVIDPGAGFIAYVSQHAIEYFFIVMRTAKSRYGKDLDAASFLGRVGHTMRGRVAFFGGIALVAWAVQTHAHGITYDAALYTVGALHFTFDSVIWKLRRPTVASNFAITPVTSTA